MSSRRGKSSGIRAGSARSTVTVMATPAAAPTPASTDDSTRSWRISRPPPAPIATLIATSWRRDAARDSCMLATLPIAAANSRTTAAERIHSAGFTSLIIHSSIGVTTTLGTTLSRNGPERSMRRFSVASTMRAAASAAA
jgi:hypothetical protein